MAEAGSHMSLDALKSAVDKALEEDDSDREFDEEDEDVEQLMKNHVASAVGKDPSQAEKPVPLTAAPGLNADGDDADNADVDEDDDADIFALQARLRTETEAMIEQKLKELDKPHRSNKAEIATSVVQQDSSSLSSSFSSSSSSSSSSSPEGEDDLTLKEYIDRASDLEKTGQHVRRGSGYCILPH